MSCARETRAESSSNWLLLSKSLQIGKVFHYRANLDAYGEIKVKFIPHLLKILELLMIDVLKHCQVSSINCLVLYSDRL